MSENVERVSWLLRNLELQLESHRLQKEQGCRIEVLFDTTDVRATLLGMQAFYMGGGFDPKEFTHPKTLVHCLAAAGWLGPIQMLPPHEAELLALLKGGFGSPSGFSNPKQFAKAFLRAIQIPNDLPDLAGMTAEDRIATVRKQVGSAEKFFKAVQCIRGTWRTRLLAWEEQGRLVFSSGEMPLASILRSSRFSRLKEVLDARRPDRALNNFADAVAVQILLNRLSQFRSSKALPVFYSSSPLLQAAIREADLEKHLFYTSPAGQRFSVLRDHDFFVFQSICQPPSPVELPAGSGASVLQDPQALEDLSGRLRELLKFQRPLQEEDIRGFGISGVSLADLFEELRELSFFESVWLPSSHQDLQDAEKELARAASHLTSKEFQKGVEEAIERIKTAIQEKVHSFHLAGVLWAELKEGAAKLRQRIPQGAERDPDPFRDLGLLRFSLPESSHERIAELVQQLRGSEVVEKEACLELVESYLKNYAKPDGQTRELPALAGLLWIFELYQRLIDVLERSGPRQHLSLRLMMAAAWLKLGSPLLVPGIIRELEAKYEDCRDSAQRVDLAIGLAYLHFHFFKGASGQDAGGLIRFSPGDLEQSRKKAVQYAGTACESPVAPPLQRAYALNQHVYYLVEVGDDDQFDTLIAKAEELIDLQGKPNWQYRFDDTLARYFARLADLAPTEAERRMFIARALRHSEDAEEHSLGDPEVKKFRSKLTSRMLSRRPKLAAVQSA
jgi:hypothetical protein